MKKINLLISGIVLVFSSVCQSIEHKVKGILDLRYSVNDSIQSYLQGGYGKFQFSDGDIFALAQLGISYNLELSENWEAHIIANGYADHRDSAFGFSEAFLQYKSLPSESGWRIKTKAGFLYPKVSMVNFLTAWSSPYTLNYDVINGWLAEEVRHQGVEFSLTKLGKFSNSDLDLEWTASVYRDNDPVGAMVAWHGWVSTSRQSLRHELLPLPNPDLGFEPEASDPFLELDDRLGYHTSFQWSWKKKGKLLLGYYDNNADPKVVENLQWAWLTRFAHIGVSWKLAEQSELIFQHLSGDTLMQSSFSDLDLVNNDFQSSYIMYSRNFMPHRLSLRLETFDVTDKDTIGADDNTEDGQAVTISHSYRLSRRWFLHNEINWIDSERPSRTIQSQPIDLTEKQWQIALRYFF